MSVLEKMLIGAIVVLILVIGRLGYVADKINTELAREIAKVDQLSSAIWDLGKPETLFVDLPAGVGAKEKTVVVYSPSLNRTETGVIVNVYSPNHNKITTLVTNLEGRIHILAGAKDSVVLRPVKSNWRFFPEEYYYMETEGIDTIYSATQEIRGR